MGEDFQKRGRKMRDFSAPSTGPHGCPRSLEHGGHGIHVSEATFCAPGTTCLGHVSSSRGPDVGLGPQGSAGLLFQNLGALVSTSTGRNLEVHLSFQNTC